MPTLVFPLTLIGIAKLPLLLTLKSIGAPGTAFSTMLLLPSTNKLNVFETPTSKP